MKHSGFHPVAVLLLAVWLPGPGAQAEDERTARTLSARICQGAVSVTECHVRDAEFAAAVEIWEERLRTRGHRLGEHFLAADVAELNTQPRAWYYDAARVFHQAADWLGDPDDTWDGYAQAAEAAYEHYLEPDYAVPGYERFPHGPALDHRRTGDPDSLKTLRALRDRGQFADVLSNPDATHWFEQAYSREVAYMIDTHVMARRRGLELRHEALERYVEMAVQHIRAWTADEYQTDDPQRRFCQAFMAGLTASALIDYYRLTAAGGDTDKRIPTAIRALADWLIDQMWVANHAVAVPDSQRPRLYGSFRYVMPTITGVGSGSPTPDLNMLIVPMYGWLYLHTGELHYRTVGDMAFIGGVAFAWLKPAKTFNQNYRSSFSYLEWRDAGNRRWAE